MFQIPISADDLNTAVQSFFSIPIVLPGVLLTAALGIGVILLNVFKSIWSE